MALVIADRVEETSSTTGTGTYDLAGATTNMQGFVAGIGTGNTCHYRAQADDGSDWEVGIGTVTDATPDTLARTTILASSNGDAAVNWTGDTTIACVLPGVVAHAQNALDALGRGRHAIYIPAAAMRPTVSNGAATIAATETTAGNPDIFGFSFDKDVDEHVQFGLSFPPSWDLGVVNFIPDWCVLAGSTYTVAWAMKAVSVANAGTLDVAYGTPVVTTDTGAAIETRYAAPESGDVTIAGSPAAGEHQIFDVFRDVSDGGDGHTDDAVLMGVTLFYTINAANDV
jgi:hypothetical protein